MLKTIHLTNDSTKSAIANLSVEANNTFEQNHAENYSFNISFDQISHCKSFFRNKQDTQTEWLWKLRFALCYSIWSLTGNLCFKVRNIRQQDFTKNYSSDRCSSIKSIAVDVFYTQSNILEPIPPQSYSFPMRASLAVALSQSLLQSNHYNKINFLLRTFICYMIFYILITIQAWL
jgi:hypothetical protein